MAKRETKREKQRRVKREQTARRTDALARAAAKAAAKAKARRDALARAAKAAKAAASAARAKAREAARAARERAKVAAAAERAAVRAAAATERARARLEVARAEAARPPFRLPAGESWGDVVVRALEEGRVGEIILGGVAELAEIYEAVGVLVDERPLNAQHRANVRRVLGCEPRIHRLQGGARYGMVRDPRTQEPVLALIDPETGRKPDPDRETGPAALPNQVVLDDILEAIAVVSEVEDAHYDARFTPIGQAGRQFSVHHFYDVALFTPQTGGIVDMDEVESMIGDHGRLDTEAFGLALADATARLMRHGYGGNTRVSVQVAELIVVTDVDDEVTYYWHDDRRWVSVTYGPNPRVASDQILWNLETKTIPALNKYVKTMDHIPFPVAIAFVVRTF